MAIKRVFATKPLTKEEIDGIIQNITESLAKNFQAKLRDGEIAK